MMSAPVILFGMGLLTAAAGLVGYAWWTHIKMMRDIKAAIKARGSFTYHV